MSKRSLKISGFKNTLLLLFLLLIASCAPKYAEMPSYDGIPLDHALSELKKIQAIKAVLSVDYEKGDSAMSGDASLTLSENKLDLRLYYLGFLMGEVKEENGIVIKSKPKLDKNKGTILIDGLKNSFFWWNMKDYSVQEKEDSYELKNSYRTIVLSKKTLLPIEQTIETNDGEKLNIIYEEPVKLSGDESKDKQDAAASSLSLWYPSRLKIAFKNHSVKIKVKSYAVMR